MALYYGRGDATQLLPNQIRILKLFSGNCDDRLQGNLIRCAWNSNSFQEAFDESRAGSNAPSLRKISHQESYADMTRSLSRTGVESDPGSWRGDLGVGRDESSRSRTERVLSELMHIEHSPQDFTPVPKYDALSYTWGGGEATVPIQIIERDETYEILLKPNLVDALKRLRHRPKHGRRQHRNLWIDAICIDQANNSEKSMQIPKMSDIYSKAEKVCIWLGRDADNSEVALQFVKECCKDLGRFDELVTSSDAVTQWEAFQAFLHRPWFSRRWIVQELTRANKAIIYCGLGKGKMDWAEFAVVVSMFKQRHPEVNEIFKKSDRYGNDPYHIGDVDEIGAVRLVFASDHLFRRDEERRITEKLFTLEALMSNLTAFEASEPKDAIYAILWLAHDATPVSREKADRDEERMREAKRRKHVILQTSGDPTKSDTDRATFSPSDASEKTIKAEASTDADLKPPAYPPESEDSKEVRDSTMGDPPGTVGIVTNAHVSNNRNLQSPKQSEFRTHLNLPERRGRAQQRPKDSGMENGIWIRVTRSPSPFAGPGGKEKQKELFFKFWDNLITKRFKIDYEKSLFEVCSDFLRFCVQRSHSLDIMCRHWAPDPVAGDEPLPSWIKRLSVGGAFAKSFTGVMERVNADPLVGKSGTSDKKYYKAAGGVKATWKVAENDPTCLVVYGFVADAVGHKFDTSRSGVIPSDWVQRGGEHPGEFPKDSFWRTLVGNRDMQGERAPLLWERVCRDAFTRRAEGGDLNISRLIHSDKTPQATKQFLERVKSVTFRRRLLTLQKNDAESLALGPYESKKGDLVCILHGCSVPVLLRRFVDGKPVKYDMKNQPSKKEEEAGNVHYQFIGECYVHALMDGEAWKIPMVEREPHDFFLK